DNGTDPVRRLGQAQRSERLDRAWGHRDVRAAVRGGAVLAFGPAADLRGTRAAGRLPESDLGALPSEPRSDRHEQRSAELDDAEPELQLRLRPLAACEPGSFREPESVPEHRQR